MPPSVEAKLQRTDIPLRWQEGEKKALAGVQAGYTCLALGGLWNWVQDHQPLPDLRQRIAHMGRQEIFDPDSAVWQSREDKPDLRRPVYAFGRHLESLGAKFSVSIIPSLDGGEEQKFDDLLTAQGRAAIEALPTVRLTHTSFSDVKQWWTGWVKTHQRATTLTAASIDSLLAAMTDTATLRPAQDYVQGTFYMGVLSQQTLLLLTSKREALQAHEVGGLVIDDRGFDLCRFSKDGVRAYLDGVEVRGPDLLCRLQEFFRDYAFFQDPRIPLLLATWTMGTYLYQTFSVYPYLVLRSPQKRCGKSRVLDLLAEVAFNATSRCTNPTAAVLFRDPASNGGTMLLDEIEGMTQNQERWSDVQGVLNDGYKRGGVVKRMERQGERFVSVPYPTYTPKALASLSRFAETLEDRAVFVFMTRRLRSDPLKEFRPRRKSMQAATQQLRDDCYIWALTHAEAIAALYEDEAVEVLQPAGLDDRAVELWQPLLAIAHNCDLEGRAVGPRQARILTRLARDLAQVRDEEETPTVKLLKALVGLFPQGQQQPLYMTPQDLYTYVQSHGLPNLGSPKGLANLMHPLGLVATSRRWTAQGQAKRGKAYLLEQAKLADQLQRYGTPDTAEEQDEDVDSLVPPVAPVKMIQAHHSNAGRMFLRRRATEPLRRQRIHNMWQRTDTPRS